MDRVNVEKQSVTESLFSLINRSFVMCLDLVFVSIFDFLCPIRSSSNRGHRPSGWPSQLPRVVRSCALLLRFEGILETFARPTSVLESTTIAASAAANGASRQVGATRRFRIRFLWFFLEEFLAPRSAEMQSDNRSNRTHQTVVPFCLCKRRAMSSTA